MSDLVQVYPLYDITPVSAKGCTLTDDKGEKYLDLYGGHAVISVGHSHPKYVQAIQEQVQKLGFYSNSIQNPLQKELAKKLVELSDCSDYALFLCNSGAEANENALKIASSLTQKKRFVAFEKGFHGRTCAAVAVTDNPKIKNPIDAQLEVTTLPLGDIERVDQELSKGDVAGVILEFIQGVGGLNEATKEFCESLALLCRKNQVILIADEVQSGYGRTGEFFAFQHYENIKPNIVSIAKGMGNGFPIGGVLVDGSYHPEMGALGTTFGGNHLACAAGVAVLDVLESENLTKNAIEMGEYFRAKVEGLPKVTQVKGKGLMLGLEFDFPVAELRKKLLYEHKIFTGNSSNPNLLRILPPLTVTQKEIDQLIMALKQILIG